MTKNTGNRNTSVIMTEQLKQNIKNMEAELAEMKKQLEKAGSGRPQRSDEYHFINSCGSVCRYVWRNSEVCNYRLATGNCFKTKENAELWLEIQKRAIKLRGDWKPDWGDQYMPKYWFDWYHLGNKPQAEFTELYKTQGVFYMPEHAAETLIKEYGDKLKIWICGEEW